MCAEPLHAGPRVIGSGFSTNSRRGLGVSAFPMLVPSSPDDPAHDANVAAWKGLAAYDRPFLTAFGDSDRSLGGRISLSKRALPAQRANRTRRSSVAAISCRRTVEKSWRRSWWTSSLPPLDGTSLHGLDARDVSPSASSSAVGLCGFSRRGQPAAGRATSPRSCALRIGHNRRHGATT